MLWDKFGINENHLCLTILQFLTIDVFIFLFFSFSFLSSGTYENFKKHRLCCQFPVWSFTLISCLECPVEYLYSSFIPPKDTHKRKHLYACVITICCAFTQHIKWNCTVQYKSHETVGIFDTPCTDMLHLNYFHNAYFPRLPAKIK